MIDVNSRKNLHPVQQAVEESLYLEDLLDDECKCESAHQADGNETCSVKVTHIANSSCEGLPLLICLNAATESLWFMRRNGPCSGCLRPASECWSIRPV